MLSRTPGLWEADFQQLPNGSLVFVRLDENGNRINGMTFGDAYLLANSAEMHDLLWEIYFALSNHETEFDTNFFRKKIMSLLAKINVSAPEKTEEINCHGKISR
ncbi:MAG: hypothetical protein IJQ47_11735 [Synergistaceae bacterium]|nr:hypothetical protein [Synergistaceae bacterium]